MSVGRCLNGFSSRLHRVCCCLAVTLLAHSLLLVRVCGAREVIWAVNAGGGFHVDDHGIQYSADPHHIGTPSDHGKTLTIGRVSRRDAILYQTERYHTNSFSYEVPVNRDGDYVLVLKFSEVYFTASRQKVFNVVLNDQHVVVSNLDIFDKVGLGRAHDEIIPFTLRHGKLVANSEASTFDNILKITFVKTHFDNPKINAMFLMRGSIYDVPRLPPLHTEVPVAGSSEYSQEAKRNFEETKGEKQTQKTTFKKRSGPIVEDPYTAQETNYT